MSVSLSRALVAALLVAFVGYLIWALYLSVTDIPTHNDFEVYHYIGKVAAERHPTVYEVRTPHQQRGPFIYPVSAAVLFVPLSWLPHDLAGAAFSIVKVCALALLWWGGVRFSGRPPLDVLGWLLVMLGPAVMLHRAVMSDVGNGQVNIILAAASASAIWLIMLSRRLWCLGCVLLAWAIAIKMTPALLLAIPLLHRRWNALVIAIALALGLMVALPVAWFGAAEAGFMSKQYRTIAERFTFDWPARHEQTTPTELLQFIRWQTGRATTMPADAPEVLPVPISGHAGEHLFEPRFRADAMRFWLITGLATGVAYLCFRWALMQRRWPKDCADWTWDLALLCALIVALSPRVHKAHLVVLIVPAAWLAARICGWFAPEHPLRWKRRAVWAALAYALLCVVFVIAESLPIPIAGWSEPLRALPLAGVCGLIAMVATIGWLDGPHCKRPAEDLVGTGMLLPRP